VPACVLVFNANDPSGAGGLAGDINAIASVGAHALPVVTGAYVRDTAEIFDHFHRRRGCGRAGPHHSRRRHVQVIKVGFAGSPRT
jgi:hydroxymethylpyrimidine/phosphomethylpyrimidine kinase